MKEPSSALPQNRSDDLDDFMRKWRKCQRKIDRHKTITEEDLEWDGEDE